MHDHSYRQPTQTLKDTWVTKNTSFFQVWLPGCTQCFWERRGLSLVWTCWFTWPLEKHACISTCMQLIGARYCTLWIAYCTNSSLAGCSLYDVFQGVCSVLALAEVVMLVVTYSSVKLSLDSRMSPQLSPRDVMLLLYFFLGWHLLCFKSLLERSWLLFNLANVAFFFILGKCPQSGLLCTQTPAPFLGPCFYLNAC